MTWPTIPHLDNLSPTLRTGVYVGVALLAIALVLKILRSIGQFFRSLRPARLNPNLAKYAGDDDPAVQLRRQMASRIRATSSTDQVPGYKTIQAIEALYVDGFRTPADALEGLKAMAAEKGGNAIINVHHERSSMGRCAASGDAVVAETTGQAYTAPTKPIEISLPPPPPKRKERGKGEPGGPMIR